MVVNAGAEPDAGKMGSGAVNAFLLSVIGELVAGN
jgi:hypothetical protein